MSLSPPEFLTSAILDEEAVPAEALNRLRGRVAQAIQRDEIALDGPDANQGYDYIQRVEDYAAILANNWKTTTTDVDNL